MSQAESSSVAYPDMILGASPTEIPVPPDVAYRVLPGQEPGKLALGAVLVQLPGGSSDIRFALVRVAADGLSGIRDQDYGNGGGEISLDIPYKYLLAGVPAVLVDMIRRSRDTQNFVEPIEL